jgi:hypothetical protein
MNSLPLFQALGSEPSTSPVTLTPSPAKPRVGRWIAWRGLVCIGYQDPSSSTSFLIIPLYIVLEHQRKSPNSGLRTVFLVAC